MAALTRGTLIRLTPLLAAVAVAACGKDSHTGPKLGPPAAVQVVAGDGQQGEVGKELPQALVVKVLDAGGHALPGQVVNFRVVSGGGSVFAGAASTDDAGVAQERWTLGTSTAEAQKVEVRAVDPKTGQALVFATFTATAKPGPLAALTKSGGDVQSGALGAALADSLAVTAADQYGNPVPGVSVTWAATSGGGSVSPATVTTNAAGVAKAAWTMGTRLDAAHTATATAAALPTLTFTATPSLPATAALGKAGGDGQSATVGTAAATPLAAKVTLAGGQPVSGVAVTWAVTGGGGSVTPAQSVTDASGVATAQLTLGTATGANTVTATVAGLAPATFTVTGRPDAPAHLDKVDGDAQNGVVGQALARAVQVRVTDRYGNVVPNATVTWTVTAGGGGTSAATSATDAAGVAAVQWTLGTGAGANGLSASVTGAGSVAFAATGVAGPATQLQLVSGDAQPGVVGHALPQPIVIRALDRYGNPAAGSTVTFAATNGSGSFSPATATVDAAGLASATWTIGTAVGAQSASVSASGTNTLALTATGTVDVAARVVTVSGDAQTASVGTTLQRPLVVRVTDQFGNVVSGTTVTWSVAGGCGFVTPPSSATDASGLAQTQWTLGTTAGACSPGVTARILGGASATFTATATSGAAARVIALTNNIWGPVAAAQTLDAQVIDQSGNGVPGVTVSFAVTGGSGTLSAASAQTNAGGIASVSLTPGTRPDTTFVVASTSAGTQAQFRLITAPDAPAQLLVVSGNGQSAQPGVPIPVAVKLVDQFGNGIPYQDVQWAVTSGTGYTERTHLATDNQGVAATRVVLSALGAAAVTATGGGRSATINVTAVAGSGLGLVALSPAQTDVPLNSFGSCNAQQQLRVKVVDGQGNAVPGVSVSWTASFSGAGPNPSVSDSSGVATFNVFYCLSPPGTYTSTASIAGGPTLNFVIIVSGSGGGTISAAIVSGAGQSAPVNSVLPEPVVIQCSGRAGGALPSQCGPGAIVGTDAQGHPYGTLTRIYGYYPANQIVYVWKLGPQVGLQTLLMYNSNGLFAYFPVQAATGLP